MKRDINIDVAKGIGIILVVIGHLDHYIALSETFHDCKMFIYIFHMPLFFIIAGFTLKLYNQNYQNLFIEIIKRRFNSLVVPFIISCVFYCLYSVCSYLLNSIPIDSNMIYFSLIKPLYTIGNFDGSWFLVCLFWATVAATVVLIYSKGNRLKLVSSFAFIGIIGMYLPQLLPDNFFSVIHGIHRLDVALVAAFFIGLGYLIKSNHFNSELALLISILILFICYNQNSFIDMNSSLYGHKLLFLLGGMAGTYLTIYLAQFICSRLRLLAIWVAFIGRTSLWILITHGFILQLTVCSFGSSNNLGMIIIYVIIPVVLPTLVMYLRFQIKERQRIHLMEEG